MTLILQLPPELEERLRQHAHNQGKALEVYAQEVLERDTASVSLPSPHPRKPLAGRLEHLKLKTPTLEEIQEARREIFANFPREFPAGNGT